MLKNCKTEEYSVILELTVLHQFKFILLLDFILLDFITDNIYVLYNLYFGNFDDFDDIKILDGYRSMLYLSIYLLPFFTINFYYNIYSSKFTPSFFHIEI